MKNVKLLILLCSFLMIASCSSSKDYFTLSGRAPKGLKEIILKSKKANVNKHIKVDAHGVFKDTVKLKHPSYLALSDGETMNVIYVKNGDNIKALFNPKDFSNVTLTGKGYEESAYMVKKAQMQKEFFDDETLYHKTKAQFQDKLNSYSQIFRTELAKANDSLFKVKQAKYIKSFEKRAKKVYKFKSFLVKNLGKGTEAPDFSYPYEDPKGKKYTLKSLRGKYLYIKFWATWCGYCKREAPYFKKLAKKYKGKNIDFVSISLDKERSKKVWKKMIAKSHNTIELFSKIDKGFKKTYKLQDLPRFMLIDPQGKIIDADAPAPSDKKMIEILNRF